MPNNKLEGFLNDTLGIKQIPTLPILTFSSKTIDVNNYFYLHNNILKTIYFLEMYNILILKCSLGYEL